ncbi:MAG: HNH endonuclease signature motif containing protein, partial [Rhodospirillaceae bacterium]|nr:HNH endonuclease signature motif containing protein [Rhodospirillaceae bacterium]
MRIRDGGCRFPGCNRHRWTDAHHIHHWADGGETSLENLVTLCRYHYRELHRGQYRIERSAGGELIFMDAQQRAIPPAIHPQFGDWRGSGGAACAADTPDVADTSDTPDTS